MSNFWQVRHRLLIQQCEKLANQLSGKEDPGRILFEEQAVRLLTGVVMVLRQHKLNKRGQCRACAAPGRFWLRRPRCAVYRDLSFAMSQGIVFVWWQLLESVGQSASLDEVREWIPEWERLTTSRRQRETHQEQEEQRDDH